MPSAVPPDQCHVRPRVVFLSPRSPFTLNHPVVFHFRCHFTSPLIVSSVSFSTPPSVSVLPRSDEENLPRLLFAPLWHTGKIALLFYFNGFFFSCQSSECAFCHPCSVCWDRKTPPTWAGFMLSRESQVYVQVFE